MKCPLLIAVVLLLSVRAAEAAERLSFNRDIRPILSDACFQCHGPDEKQRKAGLRLDVRDIALKPAESGAVAIVPGQPNHSEIIKRVLSTDDSLRMPPANSGKKITPAQIELLKRWIADGAEYQGHWAFIPPVRPAVPVRPLADGRKPMADIPNPIDQFVLAGLDQAGLKPSSEADRVTLIRRVTLDLTGLPPTPKEVDAFLADTSGNAYEKVVDRLLKSPRHGEHQARQWLDFARYADSNGFQVDSSRFQWPWRDWVINAFNSNMPFDQFTIEQLAGDLLPNATPSQIVATGFNRNHRLNGEGGLIAEEWRVETVIDRVETTGMTWLGLTMNCCRCHDHKFDPISQRDFYSMFAFFNNVAESGILQGESKNTDPTLTVPTVEQESELKRLDEMIATANARAADEAKRLPEYIAAWEPGFREKLKDNAATVWSPLVPKEVKSAGGATLTKQADGTYLASGTNPAHDIYTITAPLPAGSFSGVLLECLPDDSLPMKSLGRYPNGNFVLSSIAAEVTAPGLAAPLSAKFVRAEATYSQKGWEIGLVLDGSPSNGWAVDGPTRRDPTSAMFLVEGPLTVPENATLTVTLKHEALSQHNIGRFRLSFTSLPPSTVKLDGAKFPEALKAILELAADKRSDAQKTELANFFKANIDSPLKQAEHAAASAKKSRDDLASKFPSVMIMKEGATRDAFILIRGEYDKRGEKVGAALPTALSERSDGLSRPSSEQRPGKAVATEGASKQPAASAVPLTRLDLAKWIVSRDNPLTARVWVNRAWEKFFGTGLVKTTENLGSQAEFPSHPELLDWLAVDFSTDWDMKRLQKLIVMSATYRQSSGRSRIRENSDRSPKSPISHEIGYEGDPDNRLLSHGPRVRLSAEMLRDQALFASGLLVEKVGGPSVRPYMPDGVWDETSRYGDLRGYKHDTNDGLYRRTLYTIWKRTAAPPSMLLFDAPSREICTVKRSRTNTPLQALTLLNEITYVEAARKLGERMLLEGGKSPTERLTFGFRWATSRKPTDDELAVLIEGLNEDLSRLKQQPDAVKQVIATGESKPNTSLDPTELAAYTLTANVLLNLDEVVTRE
jgi:hypothetical protein